MAAVVFDPTLFKARYPEFTSVLDATLNAVFYDATLYLNNLDAPVKDETRRLALFNMLVAHITTISGILSSSNAGDPTTAAGQTVGRLSGATEGSVSVSYDFQAPTSPGAAWFTQTQYGFAFWQATAYLRSLRIIACPAKY
jgi:hypothetical protein